MQGKDYAEVKERVLKFREDNPNGLIETTPTITEGNLIFKARVLKDKGNEASAESIGHAYGLLKGEKTFEKLETIAVGRALALLGYGANGAIASSEEMEEFLEYQNTKREEALTMWSDKLDEVKTLEELKLLWVDMPVEAKKELKSKQEEVKAKLA